MSETKKNWEIINKSKEERPKVQSWKNYFELPPASLSLPLKGSAGLTGKWRTFKPVVDYDKCIQCYQCYMYCPEGVIAVNNDTQNVETDYDYCKGCGICAKVCPKKCISMEKEIK